MPRLSDGDAEVESESIRVTVRFRPQNEKEAAMESGACMTFPSDSQVKMQCAPDVNFAYDRVFTMTSHQKEVYEYAAKPIIKAVLKGFNGTIFAYGQTSSGKTFTMQGPDLESTELQGIIPRMVFQIFDGIYNADDHIEFLVKVSILEIYQERLRDLLDVKKDNLKIHEDKTRGVFIGDITELYVQSEPEIFEAMKMGNSNRTVAYTNMNADSSRSHMVFILTVEQKNLHDRSVKVGKLYLVDLAGSEKVSKTEVSGKQLEEAKNINMSLSVLGRVIYALTESNPYVPYRDSKLTRMLQESLGGNSKTSLIVTCSPALYNEAETMSTLRFGQRAKMIKNKAQVNQERSAEELQIALDAANRKINNMRLQIQQLASVLEANGMEVPAFDKAQAMKASAAAAGLVPASGGADAGGPDASDMLDEMQDLKNELAENAEQVTELRRNNEESLKIIRQLEEKITESQNKATELNSEREAVAYEKEELTATMEKLKADLSTRDAEIESMQFDKKLQKEKIAEIERKAKNRPAAFLKAPPSTLPAEEVDDDAALHLTLQAIRDLDNDPSDDDGMKTLLRHLRDYQQAKIALKGEVDMVRQQNENIRKQLYSDQESNVKWENERSDLLRHLEQTQQKVIKLELHLAEESEKNNDLQEKLKDGDRPLKRKVSQLDKNLEQLTVMYHKLVSQNSGLKVECQVNEKKIHRKEQRIQQLERNLREAKNKYEKLLTQCANLTAAMDVMGRARQVGGSDRAQAIRRATNIVRPLKGGKQVSGDDDKRIKGGSRSASHTPRKEEPDGESTKMIKVTEPPPDESDAGSRHESPSAG
eukprot:GEMP01003397.1.p1 GENE.GEMP01003397.1~~GEMP01003397.1.p1  ORF type:complete len:820 (+),score=149.34 GEMP01003397.1:289-2748(+)